MTAPSLARATDTPPPAQCASFVGARRLRVTRLNSCGRPIYGPRSQVVSDGFVSVEISPESEEGEDYTTKNAAGDLCISEKGQDTIKWYTVSIEFCRVDPDLFQMMNPTWKKVMDAAGETATGWRMGQQMSDTHGFALELWPKAAGAGASCLDDSGAGDFEVNGYFLLPWVLGTAPESWTLENGAATFTLNGRTRAGSLWGKGPRSEDYYVTRDKDGKRSLLNQPIDPGFVWPGVVDSPIDPDHFHAEIVSVPPPKSKAANGCGAFPLWNTEVTPPTCEASVDATNKLQVHHTISNWASLQASTKHGSIDWGDRTGTTDVTPEGTGATDHTYAAAFAGQTVTISYMAADGAPYCTKSVEIPASVRGAAPVDHDDDPHTVRLTLDDPPAGEFAIDWGDGVIDTETGPGPFRHTYAVDGTYTVVTTDESGAEKTRDQVTVPKEQ